MSYRKLIVLALVAGAPAIASAQFTTFIPPKNKAADSVKAAVVAETKAKDDSLVHTQLTNMKTWVDSAAGLVAVPPTPVADSLALATTSTASVAPDTTFRNGSRAPATASSLPLIVLVGTAALLLGVFLLGSGARVYATSRAGSPRARERT